METVEKVAEKVLQKLESYVGKDLEYKEYEPLFDCALDICEKQKNTARLWIKQGFY